MTKKVFLIVVFFFNRIFLYCQPFFQLAPPFINYSSIFFKDTAAVTMSFAQTGTSIHYTINGNEPSENDLVYKGPVIITKNLTTIKARVFGKDFLPSGSITATFVKDGLKLKEVIFPDPNERYSGEGSMALMDNKGGNPAYSTKTWLGFKQDSVVISIALFQRKKVSSVLFDLLQDQGSWIFFPERAEVYGSLIHGSKILKLGQMNFLPEENKDVSICRPFIINFSKKIKTDKVTLKLYILKSIPEWHPGKGQKSWIFIDEVKLY